MLVVSCFILIVSAILQYGFFPIGFFHTSCPANLDNNLKCNMRLAITVYNTNHGNVDLKITGPEGIVWLRRWHPSNGIPWAAKGNKPQYFDKKGTWDLTVGKDGQVPLLSLGMVWNITSTKLMQETWRTRELELQRTICYLNVKSDWRQIEDMNIGYCIEI